MRFLGKRLAHDPTAPALVLSPHFDDAVLDCWSVLSGPGAVTVVNLFAAPPLAPCLTEWDRLCGAQDSIEWTERRRAEDAEALALVGRAPVNLGFRQASVRALARERPPGIRALETAVAGAARRASAVHAPAAIGGHADHLLVRALASRLARRGLPVYLHADLPYAVRTGGWPTWVDADAGSAAADDDWRQFLNGTLRAARADVVALTREAAAAKLAALRLYRTQFEPLDGDARLLSRPGALAYEVSWQLGPDTAEEAAPPR